MKKLSACVACNSVTVFFCRMPGKFDPTTTLKKDEYLNYVRCPNCGTIQQYPIPSQKKLTQLVSSEYSSNKKRLIFEINTSNNAKAQHMKIVETIIKLGISKNILEVGTGVGNLCSYLIKNKVDCKGIDISPELVKYAKKRKLPIELKNLMKIRNEKSLSAIVMSHVFEHLANPNETLDHINKLLQPKGFFFTAQPTSLMTSFLYRILSLDGLISNPVGLAYLNMNPWHIVLFSTKGMRLLGKKHNFKLIKVIPMPSVKNGGLLGLVRKIFNSINVIGIKIFQSKWPLNVAHLFVFKKINN